MDDVLSSKAGSAGAMGERRGYGGGEPRRRSLLEKLSNLLSHLGVAEGESNRDAKPHEASLEALRQRMTPPKGTDEPPLTGRLRKRDRSSVPAPVRPVFDAQARALDDFPVPGEVANADWKPVLLSEQELPPAIPSIDELAEEGGLEPSTPRFPVDS